MKQNRVDILFIIVFGLAGLGLIIGAISWHIDGRKAKETCIEIPAKIVKIETYRDYSGDNDYHHMVYVSYSYNGTDYENVPLNYYSSSMHEGKEITLLCDPEYPGHIESTSEDSFGVVVMLIIGVIFFLVGFLVLINAIKSNTYKKNLLARGQTLHATVDGIDYNTNYRVNGKNPFILYCSYYDQYKNVTYRFKSENLWTDPRLVLPRGSYVKVFVDASDYSKYYVDVDSAMNERIVDYT